MRVTNSMLTQSLQANLDKALSNYNDTQQEISTGKKLNLPSDDPAGAAQAILIRQSLVDNNQYQRDTTQAKSFLSATDTAYNSVENIISAARQIASQGANSTQTTDSYNSMVEQVDGLVTSLINVANSDIHGKYLFSGTKTQTPPYVDNAAAHATQPTYQGDTGSIISKVSSGTTITLNTPGSTVFDPIFTTLRNLKANLTAQNISAISADITSLDNNLGVVTTAHAQVGAQLNQVQNIQQQLSKENLQYQDSLSNIEDVDLSQAYVQLQSDQNVYQASLVTTARAFQQSLVDYMK